MRSFGRNDRGRFRSGNEGWDNSRSGNRPSSRFDSFHHKTPSKQNYESRSRGNYDGDRNRGSGDGDRIRRERKSEDGW